jgi:hypothetical protein
LAIEKVGDGARCPSSGYGCRHSHCVTFGGGRTEDVRSRVEQIYDHARRTRFHEAFDGTCRALGFSPPPAHDDWELGKLSS